VVYFPHDGVISPMTLMENGAAIESAPLGREGALGLVAAMPPPVEARFFRWLLSCRDRIDSDTINLTQEFLADMLGVQRTTVTAVAGSLQAKGIIRYRRGVVDILNRAGLETMACECYGAVRRGYERPLPLPFG
jgi:hypothetical protein